MSQHDHKQCYGTMFPSTLRADADKPMSGKVFAFELRRAGGTFVSDRRIAVKMAEWDDCLACSEFDDCYKLSLAKLTLEAAIAG
jgi:hypothetical protein